MNKSIHSLFAPFATVGIVALGVFTHRGTLRYGLLGFDTFPQIASSRFETPSDVLDIFREPIAARYLQATFFRPLQSTVLGLEHAAWGLDPLGYHLTSLTVFAACAGLMFMTTRRLLGGRAMLGPVIAGLFFVLHPSLLDVIPIPARRSELLVIGFFLAALLVLPIRGDRKRGWTVFAGVMVWLACGAKEIGVAGAILVFAHQFLFGLPTVIRERIDAALKASIPAAIGALIYVINHVAVVGGMGAYHRESGASYGERLFRLASELPVAMFCRSAVMEIVPEHVCAAGTIIMLTVIALALIGGSRRSDNVYVRDMSGTALVGIAWTIAVTLLLALSSEYRTYYALLPVAGLAIVLAACTQWALTGAMGSRVLTPLAGFGLAIVMGMALWASPLRVHYAEYEAMTESVDATLAELRAQIERWDNQTATFSLALDRRTSLETGLRPRIGVPHVTHYTLQAWADLSYGEGVVQVERAKSAGGRAHELRVTVRRGSD